MNFNELAKSEFDLISSEAEKNTAQSKLDLLSQRREEKLSALSAKPAEALTGLAGLTGDAFKEQLSAFAQMDQNNLTAEDLQYALGYATTNPIQRDEEGKRFKLQEDAQGNFIEDANGQNQREYLTDGWSPGRNVYIDSTKDDNMKLGLAAEEKGFLGRYTPDWKQYVPFMKGYGWAPGEKGVTPEDGSLMDITLDYDLATNLEKVVHSNVGQIKNRAIGQGPITQEAIDQFGSGKTEYTTPNAPMWNIDYKDDGTALKEGTPLPKPVYARGSLEEFLDKHKAVEGNENTLWSESKQTLASGSSGVLKGAVELADAAQELATWGPQALYNKVTGKNIDIDLIPDDFKKSVREGIDKGFGYDAAIDEVDSAQIKKLIDDTGVNLFDPDTWGKVKDEENQKLLMKAVGVAFSNPSLIIGGITEIFGSGGMLGAGTKTIAKIGAKVLPKLTEKLGSVVVNSATKLDREMKAIRTSGTLTEAEKVAALTKLEDSYTVGKKAVDIIKGSVMTNADMAVRMNQWTDDFKKNNKDENGNEVDPSIGKIMQMAVMARAASAAEVGSMKLSFGVKDGIKALTEDTKKTLWNGLKKAAGHFGTSIPVEGVQETFDGIVETIATQEGASKYEGKTLSELLEAESSKILTGTVIGIAGGGLMATPKGVKEVASPIMTGASEKVADLKAARETELKDAKVNTDATNINFENLDKDSANAIFSNVIDRASSKREKMTAKEKLQESDNIFKAMMAKESFVEDGDTESKSALDAANVTAIELRSEAAQEFAKQLKDTEGQTEAREQVLKELENVDEDTVQEILAAFTASKFPGNVSDTDANAEPAKMNNDALKGMSINLEGVTEGAQKEGSVDGISLFNKNLGDALSNLEIKISSENKSVEDIVDSKINPTEETKVEAVITPEMLGISTGETDTHTEGLSEKSLRKMAKDLGIDAVDLQATMNSAVAQLAIRKMKTVSKESNNVQYEIYHGKKRDGLLPTYAKYRAAIQRGDRTEASKAIKSIQNRGYTQERRLNRYAVKYDGLVSSVKTILSKGTTEQQISWIRQLDKADYRPAGATQSVKATDVIKDIEGVDPKVLEGLKIESDGESKVLQIMRAMDEARVTADMLLASAGQGRKRDTGVVTSLQADRNRYTNRLEDLTKTKAGIEEELKTVTDEVDRFTLQLDLATVNESIANNEAGSKRIGEDGVNSKNRWESRDQTVDIEATKKDLAKLEKIKKPSEADLENIDALKNVIKSYNETEETLVSINANIGKKVGEEAEGKLRTVESLNTTSDVLNKIRNTSYVPTTEESTVKETVSDEFTPTVAKEDIPEIVKELQEARIEEETLTTKIGKQFEDIKAKQVELKEKLQGFGLEPDIINNSLSSIINSEKIIEELRAELAKKEKEQKKEAKSYDRIMQYHLDKHATELDGVKQDMSETATLIEEALNEFIKNEKEINKADRNVLKSLQIKFLERANSLGTYLKGFREFLYKYLQKKQAGQIAAEIQKLNQSIKTQKQAIVASTARITEQQSINSKKILSSTKTINELKDKKLSELRARKESIAERTALRERIQKLKSKLINTTLSDKLIATSMSLGLDPVKAKDKNKYDQLIDISSIVETKPSIFGGVPVKALLTLLDKKTAKDFEAEMAKTKNALEQVIKLRAPEYRWEDLRDAPALGLLFNKNGTMNEQVIAAIALANWTWAGTKGNSNLFNSRKDVARMLGYVSDEQVKGKEYKLLKKEGSYRSVVGAGLAADTLALLGITLKKDGVSEDLVEKFSSSLGLINLLALQGDGLIKRLEETNISGENWNKVFGKTDKAVTGPEIVNMVHSINDEKVRSRYQTLGELSRSVIDSFNIDDVSKNYKLTPPSKNKDYSKVHGTPFNVPVESQKVQKTLENVEYGALHGTLKNMQDIYGEGAEGRAAYLKSVGWKDTEEMTKSGKHRLDIIDAQEGINRGLEHDYDALINMLEKVESGKINNNLWFDWFFTQGGRYNLDSAGVNPQSDKLLHRWLVLPKSAQNVTWEEGKGEWKFFLQGVAQGLGIGIDKTYNPEIEKGANRALLADPKEIGQRIKEGGEFYIDLNGKVLTEKEGKTLLKKSKKEDLIKYEVEHPGHAIQAMTAIKAYQKSNGKPFQATMVSEYDSITSGFANKLLQMPILGPILDEWLRKTGVFSKSFGGLSKWDSAKGMNDIIAAGGNPDAYKSLVKGVHEITKETLKGDLPADIKTQHINNAKFNKIWTALKKVEGAIPDLVEADGSISSRMRNLFKYPFMIFGYGSSIKNIRKSLSNDLASEVIDKIVDGTLNLEEGNKGKELLNELGITTQTELNTLLTDLRTRATEDVYVNKSPLLKTLSKLYDVTYGEAVEKTMNENFGGLVKVNNMIIQSTKLMFEAFIKTYEKQAKDKSAELGLALSKKELNDLVMGLTDKFPLIRGPLSEGREDGIAIFDTVRQSKKDSSVDKASLKTPRKGAGTDLINLSVQAMTKKFAAAHASGAVLPMHWIDGTIISALLKKGLLGIHDAGVIGNNFEENIKALNKAAYEVGKNFDLFGSILTSYVETLSTLTQEEVESLSIEEGDETISALALLKDMEKQHNEISANRKELYDNEVVLANFAGPNGVEYNSKEAKIQAEDVIIGVANPKVADQMIATLKGIINDVLTEEC